MANRRERIVTIPPSRQHRAWTAILFVALLLAQQAGCTNEPGALELRLTPQKGIFRNDEPIRVSAILFAKSGTVCLWRSYCHDVEFRRAPGDRPCMATRLPEEPVFYCGTGAAVMLILMPWIFLVAPFDVADVGGRFDALGQGKSDCRVVEVVPIGPDDERGIIRLTNTRAGAFMSREGQQWPTGEFLMTLRLANLPPTGGGAPGVPLFWKPYDQPVSATIPITIVAGPTSGPSNN